MTIIPTIVSGILSLLLWVHFRRSFKRHVVDVFAVNSKWIMLFDFLTVFSIFTRFLLRFESFFGPGSFIPALVTASYVALGFMGLFVIVLSILDFSDLCDYLFVRFIKKDKIIENSGRRNFLKKNLTLATLAGSSFATGIGFANSFDPKKKSVGIKLLPQHSGLQSLRVVQLSDIHIGPS